jgi:ATP-dependent DNA ligase
MVAFDLLYFNGYDHRKLPLIERRALLLLRASKTGFEGAVRNGAYPSGHEARAR